MPRWSEPAGPSIDSLGIGSQLALGGVTVAAMVSMARLFRGASFLPAVLVAVVLSHVLAWGTRRLGIPLLAAAALSAVGLVVTVTWLVEPHTTTFGIPGGATWTAVDNDLADAWERFGEVRAPTDVTRGFVLVAATIGWLAAFVSDLFAFRLRARFEALMPSFTIFAFASILAPNRHQLAAGGLYLAAVLLFLVLSEASRRARAVVWFGGRAAEGGHALARGGLVLAAAAVFGAVIVGPNLPGADEAGLLDWRERQGQGSGNRVAVSPLVDIRGRLVDRSDAELFTVSSDSPSYWRLTALDRFDGIIWSSLGTYQPARRSLPGSDENPLTERVVNQQFTVSNLASIWLPAAFRPDRLQGPGGVRYDRESASLVTDAPSSDGMAYTVRSAVPVIEAEQLIQASSLESSDDLNRYLDLPDDFPASAADLAREVTASASTNYERARVLQDWFRTEFTYDLDIDPGHGNDAIERFLDERRGYCEQFAGTYAAMARSLGIPARVAVGFTPGTPAEDGIFHVAGRDAHAWPEVYFSGVGWVAFEPTPGRGAPGAEEYTGVAPQGPSPASPDGGVPATTTTTIAAAPNAPAAATTVPTATTTPPREEIAADPGRSWLSRLLSWPVLLPLLFGLYVGAVLLIRSEVRRRRRLKAVTAADRVRVAWLEALEALAAAGVRLRPSETAAEYAARAGADAGAAREPLHQLAGDQTAAAFSESGVGDDVAIRALAAAEAVETEIRARATRVQRVLWALDPRPLLPSRRPLPA